MTEAMKHELEARRASDWLIAKVIADLEKRNLRNLRDNETRWLAGRSKAMRAERRRRKKAKQWNPIEPLRYNPERRKAA